jgi:hypothetical protein
LAALRRELTSYLILTASKEGISPPTGTSEGR